MGDRGERLAAVKRAVEEAQRELASHLDYESITQEVRDLALEAVADLGRDFKLILEEAEDAAESALSEQENAESAKEDAEIGLRKVLSGESCPFCGTALLTGEAIHDCRKCRADKA